MRALIWLFTFHYGQIYYSPYTVQSAWSGDIYIPLWLDLLFRVRACFIHLVYNLHSTMVRFIMERLFMKKNSVAEFTFHYGQIYYFRLFDFFTFLFIIYIPLWLDLLLKNDNQVILDRVHLHSTMVRFIMSWNGRCLSLMLMIYIPLWLDLLFLSLRFGWIVRRHLHSTMVRFTSL